MRGLTLDTVSAGTGSPPSQKDGVCGGDILPQSQTVCLTSFSAFNSRSEDWTGVSRRRGRPLGALVQLGWQLGKKPTAALALD